METLDLIPNTPKWLAHRAKSRNASEAAAQLGCSPYMTRTQLLHALHTGLRPEPDPFQQRLFDEGHRTEALARVLAEAQIGEDLYPVVGTEVVDGVELSASFDGLTILGDVNWEHKLLNDELRSIMPNKDLGGNDATLLPKFYRVQMEQQIAVSGCEKVLFMASEWQGDKLLDVRSCWYYPDLALRAEIVAGWKQLDADLAVYVPQPASAPAPVGRAPEMLPALLIELVGNVKASNLGEFKEHALGVFKGINRTLVTDADFSDAEKTVKWCGDVESRLEAAKQHALSQTASIEELFRTIDDMTAECRRVRLDLDKLVKARKEQIRQEIVYEGTAALRTHIANLNTRIGQPLMPQVPADFAGAVKGKRTVDSLRNAIDTELARAKIEANAIADRIQINLAAMHRVSGEFTGLFPDLSTLVLKPVDDFEVQAQARVDRRKAENQARLDAERERIAAEERAKAEAAVKAEQERQRAAEAEENRQALIQAEKFAQDRIAEARADGALPAPLLDALSDTAAYVLADAVAGIDTRRVIGAARVSSTAATAAQPPHLVAVAPPVAEPDDFALESPTAEDLEPMTLGQINELLGGAAKLDAEGIKALGFDFFTSKGMKNALLYRRCDVPKILRALVVKVEQVARGFSFKAAA